jgi:hypothetical protein
MPQIVADTSILQSQSAAGNTDPDNLPIQILALTNRQQQTNNNNTNK